jgi:hypothetical protein
MNPSWLLDLLLHARTRYLASWLLVLPLALSVYWDARIVWDQPHQPLHLQPLLALPRSGQSLSHWWQERGQLLASRCEHLLSPWCWPTVVPPGGRGDGNAGHITIDFGGQWLFGRLLVEGHGRALYDGRRALYVAQHAFARQDENPNAETHDAETLISHYMFQPDPEAEAVARVWASTLAPLLTDTALAVPGLIPEWNTESARLAQKREVRGPLYPPTNAFVMAPLACVPPLRAYLLGQILAIGWAFLAGLGVAVLSRGTIWWPLATLLILHYPGFRSSLQLGQNAALSLTIAVWGWALVARGRPGWGGVVWGLFAFKPVWGASFLLMALLLRRWSTCGTMVLTGASLAALTVPLVGMESWRDWLTVGRIGAATYDVDWNWVRLSRDLFGLPRRFLIDFRLPYWERDRFDAWLLGWLLWVGVLDVTARSVVRWGAVPPAVGPAAGCAGLAAWVLCYHFMYYDVLLSALPVCILLADRRCWLWPTRIVLAPLTAVPWHGPPPLPASAAQTAGPSELPSGPLAGPPPGGWSLVLVNSFLLTALLALWVIDHLFAVFNGSATFAVPGGSPPWRLELTMGVFMAWDQLVLLALWAWSLYKVRALGTE